MNAYTSSAFDVIGLGIGTQYAASPPLDFLTVACNFATFAEINIKLASDGICTTADDVQVLCCWIYISRRCQNPNLVKHSCLQQISLEGFKSSSCAAAHDLAASSTLNQNSFGSIGPIEKPDDSGGLRD